MPPYLRLGSVPPKRHTAHPQRPGFKDEGIYYEEVVTLAGFSRAYSLVYHLRPPTRVVRIEPARSTEIELPRPAGAAAPSSEDAFPSARRRSRFPGAWSCLPMMTSRWLDAALKFPRTCCFEMRMPTRYSSSIRAGAPCTRCSARCPFAISITSSSPAAQPIASTSSPALRPISSSSRDAGICRFRPGISIRMVKFAWARLTGSATFTARARRPRRISSRKPRC